MTTIYHNSRCSKSRQTLALLSEKGIEPTIVNYLESPPDAQRLGELVEMLGVPASRLVRFKEKLAGELGLSAKDERTDAQWCELLAANPSLIERPIVVNGKRAAIGRPPENVLDII